MRRTGKTTRLIDRAIQELFTNGVTYVYEGRYEEESFHAYAMEVLSQRMHLEHEQVRYSYVYGCYDGIWCYKVELHNL